MKKRNQILVIAFLGRSGSGKGTQTELLVRKFGLHPISSGDLFRGLIQGKTLLGKRVKSIVNSGGLPAGWVAIYLWMREILDDTKRRGGYVFEGAPRRLEEATMMDDVFPFVFGTNVVPVLLEISEKEARIRLIYRRICSRCKYAPPHGPGLRTPTKCSRCGGAMVKRKDDTPAGISSRMRYYKTSVEPIIRYYQKQHRLIRVNGEQHVDDVFEELIGALKRHQ